MNYKIVKTKDGTQAKTIIDGHEVTCSFAQAYNPDLASLIRSTLLDTYIRKMDICPEGDRPTPASA